MVEVTDGDNDDYTGAGIPYFVAKCGVRAIGRALGAELAKHGDTGLTVTPGFLRSEAMLEHFGVTEKTWREAVGATAPPDFAVSETPTYLGRAVAALATDPDVSRFAGRTVASWTLMHDYGFTDADGTGPTSAAGSSRSAKQASTRPQLIRAGSGEQPGLSCGPARRAAATICGGTGSAVGNGGFVIFRLGYLVGMLLLMFRTCL